MAGHHDAQAHTAPCFPLSVRWVLPMDRQSVGWEGERFLAGLLALVACCVTSHRLLSLSGPCEGEGGTSRTGGSDCFSIVHLCHPCEARTCVYPRHGPQLSALCVTCSACWIDLRPECPHRLQVGFAVEGGRQWPSTRGRCGHPQLQRLLFLVCLFVFVFLYVLSTLLLG